MLALAALINVSSSLGYLLPAIIGLESMGIPSPGETALVLAAVLASQGKLEIWLVIPIAIASAIIGDNIGYFLGRHLGRDVLVAAGPFAEHRRRMMAIGDRYFAKYGARTIFIGRWVALIRFAVQFRVFFVWNALGAITWGLTFGLLGYFFGTAVTKVLETAGLVAAVALVVLAVVAWIVFARRRRRAEEQV
jgi:membrane protein DedA with SNARE-associated domain